MDAERRGVALDHRREQPRLVAKRCIETGGGDAGLRHQIGHRSRLVAALPEQSYRLVERSVGVKRTRATCATTGFRLCHAWRPIWNDR